MKAMRCLFIFGAILIADVSHSQFILTLNFSNMDPYVGMRSEVRVTESGSGREVGRRVITAITDASYSLDLYVLLQGRNYQVDFYVDFNNNGVYDPPTADHAWRRSVMNATMNRTIDFSPDENFTDIMLPDAFPYSQYNSVWGGKWQNQTFGSTDTIKASFNITCDSVFGSFMTAGVFGNPQTVMFSYADTIPEDVDTEEDTILYAIPAPWTGEVYVIHGEIHGNLSLLGTGLQFTGTLGAKQILCLYTVLVGGNPFANGYFYVRELNLISSAPLLEITLEEIEQNFCHGSDNGLLSVAGNGGTAPYTYLWSNGTAAPVTEELVAGEYCVTVTDADGCTVVSCYNITEPPPITLEAIVFEACTHDCVGLIDVTVSGGQPGYVLFWSHGFIGEDPGNLCVGDYSVNVLDANGCQEQFAFTITAPPDIIFDTIIIEHAMNGQSNGGFEVAVSGSTGPYLYSLEGTAFQTSPVFINLPAGEYCVYVIDGFGCEKKSEVFEIQNISGVEELMSRFNVYPNPATRYLHLDADIPIFVEIRDMHGHTLNQSPESVSHFLSLGNFTQGVYILAVSDGGRTAYEKLVIAGD